MAENHSTSPSPFLWNADIPGVAGPPRELDGYGGHAPRIRWASQAKVAVNIVVNLEEGSELTYVMGDGVNEAMPEVPFHQYVTRDLAKESFYEYGSHAGIWRIFRALHAAGAPASVFASAVALERNPATGEKIRSRGDEVVGHGYRWSNHFEMTEDEERAVIRATVDSINQTTGDRPVGWHCREMSVNTRRLLVEESGFLYDSDDYSDDLPYWALTNGASHLIAPYSLVTNDCRYVMGTGFASQEDFFACGKQAVDRLRNDGDDCGRMLSIGLHPRITGHPARASGLERLIKYCQQFDDVVFMRRDDIARSFIAQAPTPNAK